MPVLGDDSPAPIASWTTTLDASAAAPQIAAPLDNGLYVGPGLDGMTAAAGLKAAVPGPALLPCDAFFATCKDELSVREAQALAMLERTDSLGGLALSAAAMTALLQGRPDAASGRESKRRSRFVWQA